MSLPSLSPSNAWSHVNRLRAEGTLEFFHHSILARFLFSPMAPLADFLLAHLPFRVPAHYTSYVQGKTPLSTTPEVVTALASYLAIVFGIRAYMTNKQPQKLTTLFQAHNIILSAGSFVLLVLMLEETIPIIWTKGLYNALCSDEAWTTVSCFFHRLWTFLNLFKRLEFYYMINYYFKYLELIDTVFLAFKKKPLRE